MVKIIERTEIKRDLRTKDSVDSKDITFKITFTTSSGKITTTISLIHNLIPCSTVSSLFYFTLDVAIANSKTILTQEVRMSQVILPRVQGIVFVIDVENYMEKMENKIS